MILQHKIFSFAIALWGLLAVVTPLRAQDMDQPQRLPLYIVNGKQISGADAKKISPRDIVSEKMLPADEQTIAKYGPHAQNGVIIMELRYDTSARFEIDGKVANFSSYVASRVKWGEFDPVARVIISFRVNPDGTVSERDVLESSDKLLLRRVRKVLAAAPKWVPAKREGNGVATDHVLRITLPMGKGLPPEPVLIIM